MGITTRSKYTLQCFKGHEFIGSYHQMKKVDLGKDIACKEHINALKAIRKKECWQDHGTAPCRVCGEPIKLTYGQKHRILNHLGGVVHAGQCHREQSRRNHTKESVLPQKPCEHCGSYFTPTRHAYNRHANGQRTIWLCPQHVGRGHLYTDRRHGLTIAVEMPEGGPTYDDSTPIEELTGMALYWRLDSMGKAPKLNIYRSATGASAY